MIYNLSSSVRMCYPVGLYMDINYPIIKDMGQLINNIFNDKRIILWCSGSSGSIISSIIYSNYPNKIRSINYVRKQNETSHDSKPYFKSNKFFNIIVDDFICTGKTIRNIKEIMKDNNVNIDGLVVSGSIANSKFDLSEFKNIICG